MKNRLKQKKRKEQKNEKAGITFEFVSHIGYSSINSSNNTRLKKTLNGNPTDAEVQQGKIGGYGAKLSNHQYIKKVKKEYLPNYNKTDLSKTPSEDYLWLLSCGEIWSDGDPYSGENAKGYAINCEGSQYAYYKKVTNGIAFNSNNPYLSKVGNNLNNSWWLRSPYYRNGTLDFCEVNRRRCLW